MSSGHAVRMRVMDGTELDRLLLKNFITLTEHSIAEKMAIDLRKANFSNIPTSKLEPTTKPTGPHENMFTDAMLKISRIFRHLDMQVGESARNLATDVLLDLRAIRDGTELEMFRCALLSYVILIEQWRKG